MTLMALLARGGVKEGRGGGGGDDTCFIAARSSFLEYFEVIRTELPHNPLFE